MLENIDNLLGINIKGSVELEFYGLPCGETVKREFELLQKEIDQVDDSAEAIGERVEEAVSKAIADARERMAD